MSGPLFFSIPSQLELIGVFDRGVPNSERVVIHAKEATQMGEFGLLVGLEQGSGLAVPIPDVFFWFGTGVIQANSYVLVYSGPGHALVTTLQGSGDPAYVVHWGRTSTLFADSRIVPLLVHLDGLAVGQSPKDLPQLGLNQIK